METRYDPLWDEWITHCTHCLATVRGATLDITNLKLQYHTTMTGCDNAANQTDRN